MIKGVLFQVLFHHLFLEMMNDVGTHVVAASEYSLEFAQDGVFVLVFIRYWRDDQLCRVFLKRTGRLLGLNQAAIRLVSFVMGVFSTKPHLVSCTGSTLNTVILLDQCPYSAFGVQSTPRFEELSIKSLMHKKGYSVFGKIDFFSVLQFIVVSLGNSLDLDWVLLSPELSKVDILFTISGHCSNFHTTTSTFCFRPSDHANFTSMDSLYSAKNCYVIGAKW